MHKEMTLLIITQKVDKNDAVLGFFHRWLEEFAKYYEKIIVIALEVGQYDLPENVKVLSLGKPAQGWSVSGGEKFAGKLRALFNFYKYIWRERENYDAVFVHMIPIWVILGWPIFRIYKKKIYLWYVHKSVNLTLRLAERFVVSIFTASLESCRIKSKKIIMTGHGIDIDNFKSQISNLPVRQAGLKSPKFKIISAGRITPIKNYEILIGAAKILKDKGLDFEIKIGGGPVMEGDKVYFEKLKKLIKEKNLDDEINFVGAIPYKDIAEFYKSGDLFVNFSDTGSLDKAVLEAMASGLSVLTSNEAFRDILPERYFTSKNPEEIARKIIALSSADTDLGLRDYVVKNHNLNHLITKLVSFIDLKNE